MQHEKTTVDPDPSPYRRCRLGSSLYLVLLEYEAMKTIDEINTAVADGKLRAVKTAMWRGYVSRKGKVTAAHPYRGRYGVGYCVYRPNWESTRYSFVTYYVEVPA